jgi:hypothetical protein
MGKLYTKINDHIEHCDSGDILEIGMDRGEGSTQHFIGLAKNRGVTCVGVDMDLAQIEKYANNEFIETHHMSGEQYLDHCDKQFSIVYLDNFDWNYWDPENGKIANQNKRYEHFMNTQLTNVNSQQSHLLQAIRLEKHLTPNATIMCDDTWYDGGSMVYMGKCSAAIPFLLSIGFTVVHQEGFKNKPPSCVILTRHNVAV